MLAFILGVQNYTLELRKYQNYCEEWHFLTVSIVTGTSKNKKGINSD